MTRSMRAPAAAPSARLLVLAALCCAPRPAAAQAVVKVSDSIQLRFGVLLQTQADFVEDTESGVQKNVFIRRARFLVGGQLAPNVSFFGEVDHPNLGKVVAGEKNVSSGFIVQDAYLEWKLASDQLMLNAGLMFIPLCRNCYQSAASLLPIDYGAYSFLHSGPTRSIVARDTGFQARGYVLDKRLEYRVGVFQGARDSRSRNALRSAGRLQYAFLDPEAGFFGTGTYLGKKKVLTLGAGYDVQDDYQALAGDVFFERGLGPGAVAARLDFIRYDGGTTFATLPLQHDVLVEAGYYFPKPSLMPWVKVESQSFRHAADRSKGQRRYQGGLSYYFQGHNVNVKAAVGTIDPQVGETTTLFTLQFQLFYF